MIPPVDQAPEIDQDLVLDLREHIRFVQLRRQGFDFKAIIELTINERLEGLNKQVEAIKARLLQKQQDRDEWNHERIDELDGIDVLEPATLQLNHIEKTFESLQPLEGKLVRPLILTNNELNYKEGVINAMMQDLQHLKAQLRLAQGKEYPFHKPLGQLGQGLTEYLSK